MSQEEKEKIISEFISKEILSIVHFLDIEILDSFEANFEYDGKQYQLALIKEGKVNGIDFEVHPN